MTPKTLQRALQTAALFCAAAHAQQPATAADTHAPTQVAGAPAAASGRRATNAEPGSPEAKMFASYNAPLVTPTVAGHGEPAQQEEDTGKSTHGSMKIHGHWVIEVKEKDGTVKDRREFENSYNKATMEFILAGLIVPVDPTIFLSSATNGTGSMCNGLFNNSSYTDDNECAIFSSLTAGHGLVDTTFGFCAVAGSCYSGLTTSLTPNGSGGYSSWVWSATIVPVTSGTFDTVQTNLPDCYIGNSNGITGPSTISPNYCYNNMLAVYNSTGTQYYGDFSFTSTSLSTVTVVPGETLVFTVTITFS